MSDYISNSACRGNHPKGVVVSRSVFRQSHVTRLMKERIVARFLVAPQGFGKTNLALQYAELIFSFRHVFWFDCQNPCFLRDLDAATLAGEIMCLDADAKLCVFDDLPFLDEERSSLFSNAIDDLLAHNIEVLVCATPSKNLCERYQLDRLVISSSDFLVRNAEAKQFSAFSNKKVSPEPANYALRIPCVFWGEEQDVYAMLESFSEEELGPEAFLLAFGMFLLQKGTIDDVLSLLQEDCSQDCTEFLLPYLFLGINQKNSTFECLDVPAEILIQIFLRKLYACECSVPSFELEEFVQRAVQTAKLKGNFKRAAQLVFAFLQEEDQVFWFESELFPFIFAGQIESIMTLFSQLEESACKMPLRVVVQKLIADCIIGESETAYQKLLQIAQNENNAMDVRTLSAAFGSVFGLSEAARSCAFETLEALEGSSNDWQVERGVLACVDAFDSWNLFWRPLSAFIYMLKKDEDVALDVLCAWRNRGTNTTAYLLSALLAARHFESLEYIKAKDNLLASYIAGLCSNEEYSYVADLCVRYLTPQQENSKPGTITYAQTEIPRLHIRLLGGLELSFSQGAAQGEMLSTENMRKKLKSFIALLALNLGHELPREFISASLWPSANEQSAKRNLYNLWSQLRKILKAKDGSCPYLLSSQDSYQFDPRYVESDVQEINRDCKELQFGIIDMSSWSQILDRFSSHFVGEIMPSENTNKEIIRWRNQYSLLMTDALTSAAARLSDSGEPISAMWFAREALSRDTLREDAYETLMRAQIAAGQRSSALNTFFQCKKMLSEELGIDPSIRTQRLYESILDEKW